VIQRIQHVFLVLAVVLNAAYLFSPLFERAAEDPASWIMSGILAGVGIATLIAIAVIFMFKNRRNQMSWLRRGLIFQILGLGFSAGVLFSMGGISVNLIDEGLSILLPMVAFFFMIISLIYIRKDEKLVRSIDRLR
jgi:hypothetical protein